VEVAGSVGWCLGLAPPFPPLAAVWGFGFGFGYTTASNVTRGYLVPHIHPGYSQPPKPKPKLLKDKGHVGHNYG